MDSTVPYETMVRLPPPLGWKSMDALAWTRANARCFHLEPLHKVALSVLDQRRRYHPLAAICTHASDRAIGCAIIKLHQFPHTFAGICDAEKRNIERRFSRLKFKLTLLRERYHLPKVRGRFSCTNGIVETKRNFLIFSLTYIHVSTRKFIRLNKRHVSLINSRKCENISIRKFLRQLKRWFLWTLIYFM